MSEAARQLAPTLRSPALRGFELNPFRVLRLPVNCSTTAAAFQADGVLTLARLGLPPEQEDPLPWLPVAEPHELQRAAQAVEEPLLRLKQQLLWFDGVRDERAALLAAALHDPRGPALAQYLRQELPLGGAEASGSGDRALVAHAINQANLRLLLAACQASGAGVAPANGQVAARPIAALRFKTWHGLSQVRKAHEVLAGGSSPAGVATGANAHWGDGLQRWLHILSHPWFRCYLKECITDLDDDFASADDIETVEASLRTHLADLAAQEARFLLLEGRYPMAASVIAAASGSGLGARLVGTALRPLRHVMEAEISELQPLLDRSGKGDLGPLGVYLTQLEAIRRRWQEIDAARAVGLLDLVDAAAEQALARLCNRYKPFAQLDSLLAQVGQIAAAPSLRARAEACRVELAAIRSALCHFCQSEPPDIEALAVLKGQKETGRTRGFNSVTIHYSVGRMPLRRCARCARLHEYLFRAAIAIVLGGGCSLVGLALIVNAMVDGSDGPLTLGCIAVFVAMFGLCRQTLARFLTPRDHRRYTDYRSSQEAQKLMKDGYSIVAVDWRSNAMASMKKG